MSLSVSSLFPGPLSHDSADVEILWLNVSFIVVANLIIGVRLLVRVCAVKHVAADDYLMIAAGLFATAFSAVAIVGIRYGLGKHIWDLPQTVALVGKTKKVIQILWTCQIMYVTALMLVKLSIVVSYIRVFATTAFRRVMYVLGLAIVGVWICSILVTVFQCKPVRGAWDFTLPRNCLPIVTFYYFATAFSIFTDFLLCTLPLPVFWRLKLPARQKVIVSLLFAVGLVATAASAIRITVLKGVESLDVTMGSVSTMKWSVVEVGTGIVCACIPCLKPLFKNLLPDKTSSNRSAAPHTPRLGTGEESHELTKSSEAWSSWPPQDRHLRSAPRVMTQNFI